MNEIRLNGTNWNYSSSSYYHTKMLWAFVGCSCAAIQYNWIWLLNSIMCYFLLLFPFLLVFICICCLFVRARVCLLLVLCWHCHIFIWSCCVFFYIYFKSSFVFVFLHCASNKMTHNWMLLYCCLFENMLHTIISTYWAYGILVSKIDRIARGESVRGKESERKRIEIFWTLTTVLCFICG